MSFQLRLHNSIDILSKLMHKFIKSELVFILGDNGIYIGYLKQKKIKKSLFCTYDEIKTNDEIISILEDRSAKSIKIIFAFEKITVQHESLPTVQSIGKTDPIEKYCETHLAESDFYAYRVHSITREQAEIWHTVIAWLPTNPHIEECFSLANQYNKTISGVYVFPFSTLGISEKIAKQYNYSLTGCITAFITITRISDIILTVRHGNNVLHSSVHPYPSDKSVEYVQGIIEQTLSDCWLRFKTYALENNLKKVNIFLLPQELHKLFSSTTLDADHNIFTPSDNSMRNSFFTEDNLAKLFVQKPTGELINKSLRNYYRYSTVNDWFFKPLYIGLMALILSFLNTEYQSYNISKKVKLYQDKYYQTTEELRKLNIHFPNVDNLAQLADIYNLQQDLFDKYPLPFDVIKDLVSILDPTNLVKVSWQLNNDLLFSNNFRLTVDFNIVNSDPTILKKQITEQLLALNLKYSNITVKLATTNEELFSTLSKTLSMQVIIIGLSK